MRVLNFTEENKEHFKVIYEGLCMTNKSFTPKETRRLDKIFSIFEAVGKSTSEKNNYNFQELVSLPCVIHLEDADFDLIKSACENVLWNGYGARKAGKMLTWLDEAPEKETKPSLVKEESN